MRRRAGAAIVCVLALCAAVLAGCASSSTPARFHTLLPAPGAAEIGRAHV